MNCKLRVKNKEKFIFGVFLILIMGIYFSRYWNRIIPYTDGWEISFASLAKDGNVPYKDFFYYLPPLNLLLNGILWKLSFGHLIIFRLFKVIERFVIGILLYTLLCRISKPRYAWISAFLGSVLASSVVYDLLGDYNQTTDLIILFECWILYQYSYEFQKNNIKKQLVYLFFLGVFIGISFLIKQTIFVAEIFIFFVVLTVLFLIKKRKKYFLSIIVTVTGSLLTITPGVFYLLYNEALIPFIEQVFIKSGSKGNVFDILLSVPKILLNATTLYSAIILIIAFYLLNQFSRLKISSSRKNFLGIGLIFVTFFSLWITYKYEFETILPAVFSKKGIIIVSVLCFLFFIYMKGKTFSDNKKMLFVFLALNFIILFIFFQPEYANFIYTQTSAYILLNKIADISTLIGIALLIWLIYQYKIKDKQEILYWIMITASGLVAAYAVGMTCIDQIGNRALIIIFPVLFLFVLEKTVHMNYLKEFVLITISILICITTMSQKVTNAYSWWGWNENTIAVNDSYSIDIEGLEGFKVSKNVKNMYEEVYTTIEKNTTEESVIYGFPHIRIFNILFDNNNYNNFVPVPFYDVCGDFYAKEDAKLLEKNPPDIVIWCDIPECMETHEKIFRDCNELGQRDIQRWFSKEVINKKYKLVTHYEQLYIYKKTDPKTVETISDNLNTGYNSTLLNAENLDMIHQFFDGEGTKENPYLIKNENEFINFSNLVNSGCRFDNIYIQQERDLDFSEYDNIVPIGNVDDGTYFGGHYDGKNYSLSNINMKDTQYAAVFGTIGGTIENIILKNCNIEGKIVAGIAINAISEKALIINCKVEKTTKLTGWRSGGIVDDFKGSIINCTSEANIISETESQSDLYGYYAENVITL